MPPPLPVPVRESSYELNQDDELVIVERPPLTELASTPEAENVHPLQQASTTVTSCTLDRKQNFFAQDTREAAEYKHKDESDELNITLSHPLHLQLQRELEDARKQRMKLEDDLFEKSSELAKKESELAERDSELAEARKGWRKVACELNKIRTKGQGFYQVTDQYLVDKTSSLRYSIRNFAIQYVEGEMKREVQIKPSKYLESLYSTNDSRLNCLPGTLSFAKEVSQSNTGNFVASPLRDYVQPVSMEQGSQDFRPDPEAERKFQTWSATTMNLLMDALDLNQGGDAYKKLENRKQTIGNKIYEAIEPFTRHMDEGFKQKILKILDDAIVLDKEISKQVALVIWIFDRGEFDHSSIALEGGEKA